MLACILALLTLASPAATQTTSPDAAQPAEVASDPESAKLQAQLDGIKRELDQIEQSLNDPKLDDASLLHLRDRLDPASQQVNTLIAALAPRVDELNKRVAQLAPKPDSKDAAAAVPEAPDVARMRESVTKARDAAVGFLNTANALQVQAGQLATRIADKRRANFAQKILERSPSIVSPALLWDVLAAIPTTATSLWETATSWVRSVPGRMTQQKSLALLLAILFAFVVAVPGRRFALRFVREAESRREASPLGVGLEAAGVAIAGVALPMIAASTLTEAVESIGLFPPRLMPLVSAVLFCPAWILAGRALVHSTLSPGVERLRLVPAAEESAFAVLRLVTATLAVMGGAAILEAAAQSVAAPIAISVAIKGLAQLILCAMLVAVLRRASQADAQAQAAGLGPYVDPGGRIGGLARILGWVAAATLGLSPLLGFVALGWFAARQFLWAGALFTMATIALAVVDALAGQLRRHDTPMARFAHLQMGLPQRALEQVGALVGGALKAVILVTAVIVLLAPWGVESGSLVDALQGVLFGFTFAGVTVSLSSIMVAAALFAGGVFVTRLLQKWLETDFLPTTGVDAGLRNSIRTAVGYLGSFAAAAIALSALGLSVDRIAIVAGALSVGIGFGLQSIVNNFVSGLILLWERPIRVGDWVVVGDEQGIVRRINVRATEIETFDRTAIIVPNSTFISGIVKNKVLSDPSGRVALCVAIAISEDPVRARDILLSCLSANRDVLKEPPPSVLLKNFGASGIEFDLFGFVADVTAVAKVSSELRFEILKRLREEDIAHPSASTTLNTEQLEAAFAHLARAIEKGRIEGGAVSTRPKRVGERG
jgi:potassium-dependent mechanosensitive channel